MTRSAQAAGRGAIRTRNSPDLAAAGESVVRLLLRREVLAGALAAPALSANPAYAPKLAMQRRWR
ncbi:MAG: hypothetical protein ACRD9L_03795 [Bryobacteraceae bacterium]